MLRQLGLFFFISCLSYSAYAETDIRYYDVEIILFEHMNPKNRQSEDWKARHLAPESEQAELSHELGLPYVLEAESPYDSEAMFVVLADEDKKLLEEAKLIEESESRHILSHIAWRQPGLAKDQAVWVKFKQIVNTDSQDIADKDKLVPVSTITNNIDFLTGEQTFKPYIEGKVKVMLARYLHVDTDILYFAEPMQQTAPASDAAIQDVNGIVNEENGLPQFQSSEPEVFLLKQLRRRIRSTELHYLDHPVIGMLLMITPYEKPAQQDQQSNKPAGYKTLQ